MKITISKKQLKRAFSYRKKALGLPDKFGIIFRRGACYVSNLYQFIKNPCKMEGENENKNYTLKYTPDLEKVIKEAKEDTAGNVVIIFDSEGALIGNVRVEAEFLDGCQKVFDRSETAQEFCKLPRMLWALLEPKQENETCNLYLTKDKISAELVKAREYGDAVFVAGMETEQAVENVESPLLFRLSDHNAPKPKKKEVYTIVKADDAYYIRYEALEGTVYMLAGNYTEQKNRRGLNYFTRGFLKEFVDEQEKNKQQEQTAAGGALENTDNPEQEKKEMQDEKQTTQETTQEPESVDAELTERPEELKPEETESEPEPMEIEPEPETGEPEPEPIQDDKPEGAEPLDEPEPEPKEEAEMQAEKDEAAVIADVVESYKKAERPKESALLELIQSREREKGFLYVQEIKEICERINAAAWNTCFKFNVYYLGTYNRYELKPETKVTTKNEYSRIYSIRNSDGYIGRQNLENKVFCGNISAQFVVTIDVEILDDQGVGEFNGISQWGKPLPIVQTFPELLNPKAKEGIKTLWDLKDCLRKCTGYHDNDLDKAIFYRDGKEVSEPGGGALVADYTIEKTPGSFTPTIKIYLGKKGAAVVKPEPVKEPGEVKQEPAAIPEEKPAEAVVEPVAIPEPAETQPEAVEKQPEQVEAVKPTEREIRYAMSLLAMNFSRSDLVEKWLKRTKKPVRHDVVEKLIWTLDRTKVPAPGASKKEAIKAVMATN